VVGAADGNVEGGVESVGDTEGDVESVVEEVGSEVGDGDGATDGISVVQGHCSSQDNSHEQILSEHLPEYELNIYTATQFLFCAPSRMFA